MNMLLYSQGKRLYGTSNPKVEKKSPVWSAPASPGRVTTEVLLLVVYGVPCYRTIADILHNARAVKVMVGAR